MCLGIEMKMRETQRDQIFIQILLKPTVFLVEFVQILANLKRRFPTRMRDEFSVDLSLAEPKTSDLWIWMSNKLIEDSSSIKKWINMKRDVPELTNFEKRIRTEEFSKTSFNLSFQGQRNFGEESLSKCHMNGFKAMDHLSLEV